jgi:hypothetical protein
MKLYEVTSGAIGCSYVRSYVWAHDENEASRLARQAFAAGQNPMAKTAPVAPPQLVELLDADKTTVPFATTPSDEGWQGPMFHLPP